MNITVNLPDTPLSIAEVERRLDEQLELQRPYIRQQITEQLVKGKAGSPRPSFATSSNQDSR